MIVILNRSIQMILRYEKKPWEHCDFSKFLLSALCSNYNITKAQTDGNKRKSGPAGGAKNKESHHCAILKEYEKNKVKLNY